MIPNHLSSESLKYTLSHYINFNGNFLDSTSPSVPAANRSLRYGDGLFETMRWENDRIRLEAYHFERLFHGLKVLQFVLPAHFTADFLGEQIRELCEENNHLTPTRIRLNVYREESPGYLPLKNRPGFIIESLEIPKPDRHPVSLMIYSEEKKSTGILSNLKTNNYLLFIMAAAHAKKNGFTDALILNTRDQICEATSSNIFFIKGRVVHTPPLTDGCIAGVMRREVLSMLPQHGFSINESSLEPEVISEMDEGFLTNAIQGIRPISRIGTNSYSQNVTAALGKSLIKNIP